MFVDKTRVISSALDVPNDTKEKHIEKMQTEKTQIKPKTEFSKEVRRVLPPDFKFQKSKIRPFPGKFI